MFDSAAQLAPDAVLLKSGESSSSADVHITSSVISTVSLAQAVYGFDKNKLHVSPCMKIAKPFAQMYLISAIRDIPE